MRLAIIPVGRFDSDWSVLSPDAPPGRRVQIPVYSYLVETGEGRILFDTGCSHQCRVDPVALLGEDTVPVLTPELQPADHISAQLAALGIDLQDIDMVVNSHLHFDHAGGNEAFTQHRFGVQADEWQAALTDRESYPDLSFQPADASRVTLFDGDTELAPGLHLIATPGHTPGHQSLIVELRDGPFIITSDAVYTRAHFSLDNIGASHDRDQARASLKRLMELVDDGARPFFSHDPDQVVLEGWKLAPFWYE
ncbi:N-acyl homoserine lactonase family protein [Sulfobacillus harzensis]|uniref:N-acyl homoserine lactonase family protein n=1 Tax=Sulfobacillus harzensis TaxID=2729629 RepID=A0A7Y0L6D0_9FIRM|nr:N-acyl homoserine lactonase family protein [Sulfobacillus harzensis]NMP24066.1 N-acyl homoserine lactonase family protein [Sulfobacillus harzensis]